MGSQLVLTHTVFFSSAIKVRMSQFAAKSTIGQNISGTFSRFGLQKLHMIVNHRLLSSPMIGKSMARGVDSSSPSAID